MSVVGEKGFWKKPAQPQVTMQKTMALEETMSQIRRICNVDNMSDVIELYKKREENNELLAERLRDLNAEAEGLVDKIETHYKALNKIDETATEGETTAERKMMLLLVSFTSSKVWIIMENWPIRLKKINHNGQ